MTKIFITLVFFISCFSFESFAFYGKNTAGFNELVNSTIKKLTDLETPQTQYNKTHWYDDNWGLWGPPFLLGEKLSVPSSIKPSDRYFWLQRVFIGQALHYEGLQYQGKWNPSLHEGKKDPFAQLSEDLIPDLKFKRGHFPGRGYGLDCSNFVAYLLGRMGISVTSASNKLVSYIENKKTQEHGLGKLVWSKERKTDRQMSGEELIGKMKVGDLIVLDSQGEAPSHVMIYAGQGGFLKSSFEKIGYYIDSTSRRTHGVSLQRFSDQSNYWCQFVRKDGTFNQRLRGIVRPLENLL